MKTIIFGATGGTGLQLVRQALELGHTVTAFVRSPEKLNIKNSRLSVVQGDVLDNMAVAKAVKDHDAVLVALGVKPPSRKEVVGPGTKNILSAMKKHGVRRIIVESANFMDDDLRRKSFLAKSLVATFMKGLFQDKLVQEKAVMDSGLDWVIVRPATLTNGVKKDWRIVVPSEAGMTSRISRADVADFMLKQLKSDDNLHKTVLVTG